MSKDEEFLRIFLCIGLIGAVFVFVYQIALLWRARRREGKSLNRSAFQEALRHALLDNFMMPLAAIYVVTMPAISAPWREHGTHFLVYMVGSLVFAWVIDALLGGPKARRESGSRSAAPRQDSAQ